MKKKTYEELENEVARLKRSCASYKSENTKLRSQIESLCAKNEDLRIEISNLKAIMDAQKRTCEIYKKKIADYETRSWWERFKELFWFD